MANMVRLALSAGAILLVACQLAHCDALTDELESPPERPFELRKAELFRFSRSANKGGLFAKYEQRREQQQREQQARRDEENARLAQQVELNQPAAEVQQQQPAEVAAEAPKFNDARGQQQQQVDTVEKDSEALSVPVAHRTLYVSPTSFLPAPAQPSPSSSSSSSFSSLVSSASASDSGAAKSSKLVKTITTTTTTTAQNQDQPQVAQLKEVRIHTYPVSEGVSYVVVPSSAGTKAARLEDASSSSSSSSQRSSSSSTSSETETVAVQPAPAPLATVVLPPVAQPVGPDCVLQRLIVERPVGSTLIVKAPSELSLSQSTSSSSSQSSRIVSETAAVEPAALVAPTVIAVPRVQHVARLVAAPANDAGLSKEEHFHSETRSSRQESHGLGHSSSSSSSSSSRSSKSSSSTSSQQQTAALVAAPPPIRTVTIIRQAAPVVAVRPAPLIQLAPGRSNDYSVNVDHHYSGPNVKYGYSIKQQSSEPAATKGVVVGERVVYLRR